MELNCIINNFEYIIEYLDNRSIINLLFTCTSFNTDNFHSRLINYLNNKFYIFDETFDDVYFILNNYGENISNFYKRGNYNKLAENAVRCKKYIILKHMLNREWITNVRYLIPIAHGRIKNLLSKYIYHYILYSEGRKEGEYIDYITKDVDEVIRRWTKINKLHFIFFNIKYMKYDYEIQKVMIQKNLNNIAVLINIIKLNEGTNFDVIKFGIDNLITLGNWYDEILSMNKVDGINEYLKSKKFFYIDKSHVINNQGYIFESDTYYNYHLQLKYIKEELENNHNSNWWLKYIYQLCKHFTDIKLIDYIVENIEFNNREINIINKLVEEI